jgi:excisionase family DNA binding protein
MEPLALPVPEAARVAGVSKSFLYPRVMSGEVPSYKCGSRRLVPVEGLRRWIERQAVEGTAATAHPPATVAPLSTAVRR